ncbi:MAG TPA: 50S ribosomal protein L11 methyltransferase, partial [Blastocatellia bacterium]|nr:50S ribosomal protein L11 methyltransferase [Blastocatellia bacterium]
MSEEQPGQQDGWLMLSVSLPRELEEAGSGLLFELGSTGVVTLSESETDIQIAGYFPARAENDELACQLRSRLIEWAPDGSAEIEASYLPDQDWLQKWKEGYEPVEVGRRFLIVPSWKLQSVIQAASTLDDPRTTDVTTCLEGQLAEGEGSQRTIILIDPGMAFGTGTHETTRLCLELIERFWQGGSFLDVGTGTGILAIGASKLALGSRIVGIDIDPVAVEVAKENAQINRALEVDLRLAQPKDIRPSLFDVVVANLTADLIVDVLDDLAACVAPTGCLLLS